MQLQNVSTICTNVIRRTKNGRTSWSRDWSVRRIRCDVGVKGATQTSLRVHEYNVTRRTLDNNGYATRDPQLEHSRNDENYTRIEENNGTIEIDNDCDIW